MNVYFCSHCDKDVQGKILLQPDIIKVRGEEVRLEVMVPQCLECNAEIYSEEIETRNLEMAYSEYRKQHGLLAPSDIRELRERYNLSQRGLSRLLGWGEVTLCRYESGAIQDEAHNTVLLLIAQPRNLAKIFEKNRLNLSTQEAEKLDLRLKDLLTKDFEPRLNTLIEESFSVGVGDLTGFIKFDFEKTKHMILYILEFHNTFATKINKLLWYMDFLFFNKYSRSIAGNMYLHFPYGPVPKGYELILGAMQEEGLITKEGIFLHDSIRELLKPAAFCDKSIFSDDELKIMTFILEKFRDYSCTQISQYSHNEPAYLNTPDGQAISYSLARTLSFAYLK